MPGVGFQTEGPLAENPGTIFDYEGSLSESMGAAFGRAIDTNPATQGILLGRYQWESKYGQFVSAEDARREVRNNGLNLDIPETGISRYELDAMQYLKQREIQQNAALARRSGPLTSVATFGAGLAGSVTDPINLGTSFIPVVGEARYARWLAQSEGAGERAAIRFGVGAAQGAVGTAAVEPLVYFGAQQNQLDYGLGDAFLNVAFGGLIGGGLHSIGGAWHDWRNMPIASALERERAAGAPDDAKLAAMQHAVEAIQSGEPVRADETIRAYHGSQATFDRFDSARINSGEGSQTHGYGFYFTSSETGARDYANQRPGGGQSDVPGQIYAADLKVKPRELLQWDKPFDQQSPEVQQAIRKALPEDFETQRTLRNPDKFETYASREDFLRSNPTGEAIHDSLLGWIAKRGVKNDKPAEGGAGDPNPEASRLLNEAGIKGVQYREGKANNFVIFNDGDLSIASRNGPPSSESVTPPEDPIATQASAEADARAAQSTDDRETVAADLQSIDAQINGLKAREMWTAADDKAIADADTKSAQLETAAKLYRAAAVCMSE